jgi:hypothetical protein
MGPFEPLEMIRNHMGRSMTTGAGNAVTTVTSLAAVGLDDLAYLVY